MFNKLPNHLNDLLQHRTIESERIEYKSGWNPDAIIRTLCAFANDFENLGGGYIIVGQHCDTQGQPIFPPIGIQNELLDQIQQELLAACQLIKPAYFPASTVAVVENRQLIILHAPGGMQRPYKAPASVSAKYKAWHYYIRRYGSTVEAKGEDERELLNLTAKIPFDDRYAQQAQITDLSRELIIAYLHKVNSALANEANKQSIESLAQKMNLSGGPMELTHPKNVGLLFFNEKSR